MIEFPKSNFFFACSKSSTSVMWIFHSSSLLGDSHSFMYVDVGSQSSSMLLNVPCGVLAPCFAGTLARSCRGSSARRGPSGSCSTRASGAAGYGRSSAWRRAAARAAAAPFPAAAAAGPSPPPRPRNSSAKAAVAVHGCRTVPP